MSILKFRILLVLELSSSLISGLFSWFASPSLMEVYDYAETFDPVLSETQELLFLAYLLLALILMLISFFGLFFLKNWARYLYLGLLVFVIPFYFLSGISVSSPVEKIFSDFSTWCNGAVIAIMFFSPFKNEFNKVL
ncbi:MAG: hypothetical protein U1F12_11175 [Pseudomonadales bacterium]